MRDLHACVALCALAACGFTPGKLPADSNVIDMMMEDAGTDAIPDASTCMAASVECVGDTLRVCTDAGAMVQERDCGWGCDMTGGRCKEITPAANAVVTADLAPDSALLPMVLGDGINIDTGSGEIGTIASSSSVRMAGPGVIMGFGFDTIGGVNGIGVLRVKSLRITASMSNPVRFQFTNPIAIVADGPIEIDGYVVVRSLCGTAGGIAGGFAGGISRGPGAGPGGGSGAGAGVNEAAGGGGGHGGAGGTGGGETAGAPIAGGGVYGDDTITMLVGGSGGGGGGGGGNAFGGSGGGAIQLVSNTRITIASGGINAGGCGGESKGGGSDGGGGGGAGGTILLEAPTISIAANAGLAVNGGGGGGGDADPAGVIAEAGKLLRVAAAGGAGAPNGNGGDGGSGAAAAVSDGSPGEFVSGEPGGGGGGAAGRIRLTTRDGLGLTVNAAAILSPHYLDGTTCTHGAAVVQ